jgi:hypothetical protein
MVTWSALARVTLGRQLTEIVQLVYCDQRARVRVYTDRSVLEYRYRNPTHRELATTLGPVLQICSFRSAIHSGYTVDRTTLFLYKQRLLSIRLYFT